MTISRALQESVRNPDAKRLERIRAGVSDWPAGMNLVISDGTWTLQWPDPATREMEVLATFEPLAPLELMERLATAGSDIRFLLELVERAKTRIRELQGKRERAEGPQGRQTLTGAPVAPVGAPRPERRGEAPLAREDKTNPFQGTDTAARTLKKNGDYAANCAITCNSEAFRRFLESMHGLEHGTDKEFLVGKVHQVLEIGSRQELNTDSAAAIRWLELVDEFNHWRASQ